MTISKFSTWTFVILLLISTILVAHLLFGFLTPVIMAMVIVSIFSGLNNRLNHVFKRRYFLSAGISTLVVFLLVLIPMSFFLALLTQQALLLFQATQKLTATGELTTWLSSLKTYLDSLNAFLHGYGVDFSPERIVNIATSMSQTIGRKLYASLGFLASNLLSLSFNFVLCICFVFVFFVSGTATKQFVMDLIPLPDDEKERLATRFKELSFAVFLGNGLISVAEGAIGGVLFFVFDIPGAVIWAVVMTITAFLPVIGASVVVIPAAIYLFLLGNTWQAIVFLSLNAIQLGFLETFLKPRVIGTKSQMHAVLVFLAIVAGVQIYGVFGLFYGPLLVTMFLALAQIYKEHYRDNLLKY